MRIYKRRYSDHDYHLWPFTLSLQSKGYRPWGFTLDGGGGDDRGGTSFKLYLLWAVVIVELPRLVRVGHEYGFRCSDGFFQIFYGPQTMDSQTQKSWSKHLPWTEWTFIRHTLLTPRREFFADQTGLKWEMSRINDDRVPKVYFKLKDYDCTDVVATCKIEEREWAFGTGWFKWLRFFRPNMVRRSLDISFDVETGPEKGSWKGGTTGTGQSMTTDDSPRSAMARYCQEQHRSKYSKYMMRFVEELEGDELRVWLAKQDDLQRERDSRLMAAAEFANAERKS